MSGITGINFPLFSLIYEKNIQVISEQASWVREQHPNREDNGMGDAASQLPGPCHFVRVEELAKERSVDNAFITAVGDVPYNHANSHLSQPIFSGCSYIPLVRTVSTGLLSSVFS
jgi:hypothetical protein